MTHILGQRIKISPNCDEHKQSNIGGRISFTSWCNRSSSALAAASACATLCLKVFAISSACSFLTWHLVCNFVVFTCFVPFQTSSSKCDHHNPSAFFFKIPQIRSLLKRWSGVLKKWRCKCRVMMEKRKAHSQQMQKTNPKQKWGQSERIPSHKQVQDYVTCHLVLAPTSL